MRTGLIIASCLLILVVLLFTGINTGSYDTTFSDIYNAITRYDSENLIHFSIVQLRTPRVLMAFLVGGSLAVSGYLMQVSINNPLAEPFILGTSAAASLGANLVFYGLFPIIFLGIYMPGLMAFIFALSGTLLVVFIASKNGFVQGARMLLAGIALSSLFMAIISMLAYTADSSEKLRTIIFWVMGSFENARWPQLPFLFTLLIVSIVVFTILSKQINLFLLGSEKARDLGLNDKLLGKLIIGFSVILASTTVTLVGAVGFVGLIIPHFVRAYFGATFRYNILFSALFGGIFLMLCDIISKLIAPPVGIPIGIITSFFGVPFFVYLLLKKNYRFG